MVSISMPENPNARFLAEIHDCCEHLRDAVRDVLTDGYLPLVVGGDHSIAAGSVAATSSFHEERGEVIGLICFGRHIAGPIPNLVDRLHEIEAPTLVVVGEEDEGFQRASHVLEAKIPRGERVEIPGAGHAVQLDQPEALIATIHQFLQSHART